QLLSSLRGYRQQLLNTRMMLALRRALHRRLLRLPLARLADLKTGGIVARLSGDVNTTTGLLQLAVFSPGVALVRLLLALAVVFALNWRLALMALAVLPLMMLLSFFQARRVRPIYRAIREEAAQIDGRVVETFGGIRV